MHKTMLQDHYAVIGITSTATAVSAVGWFEIVLAAGVLFAGGALLLFVFAWKVGTEPLPDERVTVLGIHRAGWLRRSDRTSPDPDRGQESGRARSTIAPAVEESLA
jgi:hypothetical protein